MIKSLTKWHVWPLEYLQLKFQSPTTVLNWERLHEWERVGESYVSERREWAIDSIWSRSDCYRSKHVSNGHVSIVLLKIWGVLGRTFLPVICRSIRGGPHVSRRVVRHLPHVPYCFRRNCIPCFGELIYGFLDKKVTLNNSGDTHVDVCPLWRFSRLCWKLKSLTRR